MPRFLQSAATTEMALARAATRINYTYGRCPAYRRLASSLGRALWRNDDSILVQSTTGATASWLRPRFLPLGLRLAPLTTVQARQYTRGRRGKSQRPNPTDNRRGDGDLDEPPIGKEDFSLGGKAPGVPDEEQPLGWGQVDWREKYDTTEGDENKEAKEKNARRGQVDWTKIYGKNEGDKEKDGKEKEAEDKDDKKKDDKKEDDKKEDDKKDDKKDDMPPPPPHGDKTPFQVFLETMNNEFEKSKEWNESTKRIGAAAHQFSESESVRRAREAYERSTGAVSSTASKAAGAIGKGAAWTWDSPVVKGVRKAANVTGDAVDRATKPIRDTEAYKNVRDVIDDGSSSRYGGWVEKEERRKRRAELQAQRGQAPETATENPNAGTNVTLHKDAAWKDAWRDFRDSSRIFQGFSSMKSQYNESENPLITTARSITDRIGSFFAENETAKVIKRFRAMDPSFQLEPFIKDLREYMLPEVFEAYVKGDLEVLRQWLSAAQFSVYEALTKQYRHAGLRSDGQILDIRNVDVVRARLLEPGEVPVFVVTARTQEVHVYRNAKTGQLAAGMEDKVQLVTYVICMTRVPEDVNNGETRGWRLIELHKSGRDWY